MGRMRARGVLARLLTGPLLAGLVGAGLTVPLVAVAAPAQAALGPVPGMVAHPISRVHLENFEWFNQLQVVDAQNRVVRTIKIAGNPLIPKPDVCSTGGRIRVNWDYTLTWQLNYFTRLCADRGMGTHDIPIDRYSGHRSMNAADLGKAPFHGGPLSHGCLRMAAVDAKYVYDYLSDGVPIYFVKTPWRPAGPMPPSAVPSARAVAGDRTVTATWAAPAVHGAAVTGYVATLAPGGARVMLGPAAVSAAFGGLTNGVAYRVSVVATSGVGSSVPSSTAAVVPFGLPGEVLDVRAVRGPGGRVALTWLPAAPNGATVTAYLVGVDGGAPVRVLPYVLTTWLGPVPAGPLHVEVAAVNAAGTGAPGVVDKP